MLADAGRGDWILCQITSNPYSDPRSVLLVDTSFTSGSLRTASYARPGKLFTANSNLIVALAGRLKTEAFRQVVDAIIEMLHQSLAS